MPLGQLPPPGSVGLDPDRVPTLRDVKREVARRGGGTSGTTDLSAYSTTSQAGALYAVKASESQIATARSFSGTTDALLLADAGQVVSSTGASAATVTIPQVSSVVWPVGSVVIIEQYGAGQVTVSAGTNVTLRAPRGAKTGAQYATVQIRHRASNEWVLEGDATT